MPCWQVPDPFGPASTYRLPTSPKPSRRTLRCVVPACLPTTQRCGGCRREARLTGPEREGVCGGALKTLSLVRGLSATGAFIFGGNYCHPPAALVSSVDQGQHSPAGFSPKPGLCCVDSTSKTPHCIYPLTQSSPCARQAPSRLICTSSPSFYKHPASSIL